MQEIYERQHRRVYKMAFLYLKNVYDAEDAVSSVFMKYLEKKPCFEDERHETAWFIQVTKNYCKNLRKSFWIKRVDLGEIPEEAGLSESGEEILSEIFKLPTKYRELLYLYYYEGYSIREIAEITGINESTLQSRMTQARKKLKKRLEAEGLDGREY